MKRKKGKAIPFLYYLGGVCRRIQPRWLRRILRDTTLSGWQSRPDADYIRRRVDFYCRSRFRPNPKAMRAGEIELTETPSAYLVDIQKYLRAFPFSTPINFRGGDTFAGGNPDVPTLIRSRRIDDKRDNGVLLNLDSRRHFLHPVDPVPFRDKKPLLFFRGEMEGKPRRQKFLELWKDSPLMDIGDTNRPWDAPGHKQPVALTDHFDYQFILALEGNDVASALQWIMMSNCVPVMPRPTAEGWLMHSLMVPGRHYIEIAEDYSDVEEKIRYYLSHPEEAEKIAAESKEWARQFLDRRRERIISYLVIAKYVGADEVFG